ncbi:MAG: hypothetical protein M3498_06505 [Deinococcota bacterium]|nr:hypothetical protein [Deinococcota bacterium]
MKRSSLSKTTILAMATVMTLLTLIGCQQSNVSDGTPEPMASRGDDSVADPAAFGKHDDGLTVESRMRAYVTACPRNLDESALSYTVSSYFNDAVHIWREYPIGSTGKACIVQEEPRAGVLTEDEAIALLVASNTKPEPQPLDRYEVVDPSDPSLHLPPIPEPEIRDSLDRPAKSPADDLQYDPNEPDPLDEGPDSGSFNSLLKDLRLLAGQPGLEGQWRYTRMEISAHIPYTMAAHVWWLKTNL